MPSWDFYKHVNKSSKRFFNTGYNPSGYLKGGIKWRLGWEEWFDLDLWSCDLKINRDHLLIEGNPCTKFGIDQVKRSKDIERTTHWARKSGLTLTFENVTWKSIGIIYSLRVTLAPSLVLIKWRGLKILSGQHLDYRLTDPHTTDQHTDQQLLNNMPPFSRGA